MPFILNSGPTNGQPYTPVQIRTAGRDVIATGTVITADPRNLEFHVANLQIIISFENDGGETRFGTSRVDGAALHLPLYNFNNPIGSGTTHPVEIGRLHGRVLLMAFAIYANSPDSLKTFHYTFMLGAAA